MGQLGNTGYGIFLLKNKMIIVHPNGWTILANKTTYESQLEEAFEAATTEDLFEDHKLNSRYSED